MPGTGPGERRDHAVAVRGADAERDQREHVQVAVDDRRPAALEERPAAPEHDRRRERELRASSAHAGGSSVLQRLPGQQLRDHEREHRRPSARATTRTAASCRRARGCRVLERDDARLERHAADRAGTRPVLDDLRVHRARVFVACPGRGHCRDRARDRRVGGTDVLARVLAELLQAARAAEVVRLAMCSTEPAAVAGSTCMPHTGSCIWRLLRPLTQPHGIHYSCEGGGPPLGLLARAEGAVTTGRARDGRPAARTAPR